MNARFKEWLNKTKRTGNMFIVNENTDIEKALNDMKMCGTIDVWIENTDTVFKVLVFMKEETYDIYKFQVCEDYFEEIEDYRQVNIKEAVDIIKK